MDKITLCDCGKCISECELSGTNQTCVNCPAFQTPPLTNADRLRAYSDEELAEWLYDRGGSAPNCDRVNMAFDYKKCNECWLDWLRQPAEGGGA